jgi:lipopolysaccharide transport system ATP-binding protein
MIHGDQEYSALRFALTNIITVPLRLLRKDRYEKVQKNSELWALKDVSFDVYPGEVIGIIGRNGAGKSTLLKIISLITEPTAGEIRIRGRVGCLLEVGTGFHPELTGRENIFLNGAILGMTRSEIKRKFDEIINFAEVDKFVDTPVKRYSSGMYVRLAFAVAAHLEPEILLVDEVLAVGDAQFQKKCLEKMGSIVKQERTVLFVSHNMQAIQSICQTVYQIEKGKIVSKGEPSAVVSQYLSNLSELQNERIWTEENAPGNDMTKLLRLNISSDDNITKSVFSSKDNLNVYFELKVDIMNSALCVGFDLMTPDGTIILRSYQNDTQYDDWPKINKGINYLKCIIPAGLLNAGLHYICPRIKIHNTSIWIVNINAAIQFEVILDHGISPLWNSVNLSNRPGKVAQILKWESA